jgi:hypothetical protein
MKGTHEFVPPFSYEKRPSLGGDKVFPTNIPQVLLFASGYVGKRRLDVVGVRVQAARRGDACRARPHQDQRGGAHGLRF